MTVPAAQLLSVNVVAELHADRGRSVRPTAIDKRPVEGRVEVWPLGLAGDIQVNKKHHGGLDKAVYAFGREDVVHWEGELQRTIPPGGFGENFSTIGLEVSDACVGERWRVGAGRDAVVVEVTMPRSPCATFARWMGEQNRQWVKRFTEYGRFGAYLRVVTPGHVAAGDAITVEHRPSNGVPVADLLRGLRQDQAAVLRDADAAGEITLCPEVAEAVQRVLDRG